MLTPAMKLNRPFISKEFEAQIKVRHRYSYEIKEVC
jgi:hypothetical protein